MQIQSLILLLLGTTATVVVASDAGIGSGTTSKATPTRPLDLTLKLDTLRSPSDFIHKANDVQRRAKALDKPKPAVKPKSAIKPKPKNSPATPAKPSSKPVIGTPAPAKPTPLAKSTATLKSTMQTSVMSKSVSASSSNVMPSSSAAVACPMRPRKRSVEDFVELDSWMGFDQTSERRYMVVVLG